MKRLFDITLSALGLILFSPVLLVLSLCVKVSDGGPIFFRQERVGRGGKPFRIIKFRSMVLNAEKLGLSITRDHDPRITKIGRLLRKTKLDELPQLWNVLIGEMSFVGPRPEVPRYVARYTQHQRKVLELTPGITDLATIQFRHEEELLADAKDPEQFYVDYCMPKKIELNLRYAAKASVWGDLGVIFRTLLACLQPPAQSAQAPTDTGAACQAPRRPDPGAEE